MSDANHVSKVRREAANARWIGQVASRAAGTVAERADELDEAQAVDMLEAVSRRFPDWMPARSVRMILAEDREEARLGREQERARAERAEASHERALTEWVAEAEARGELVTLQDKISGNVGHTVEQVLERARAESELRDAQTARPAGDFEILYPALAPEPRPAARSQVALELANRARHFLDAVAARRKADDLDPGRPGVRRRSRPAEDPAVTYARACAEIGQPVDGVRFR